MQVFKPFFVLLLAGSTPISLADDRRQLRAHQHGVGKLDIAQEGAELYIEFDSPAVNITGFEHFPETNADHDTLEKALVRLKDGVGLFALPEAAGCRLVDADIETPLKDHEEGEEEHHAGNERHKDDSSHKHAREHAEEQYVHEGNHEHEGETHADITAAYRFTCAHPEDLDQVSVRLFEIFPMIERLQVQFITWKHQGAVELSAAQPALRL